MGESKSSDNTKVSGHKRPPSALSNEYHKARKQLMLWAAILFIWELVGIDLDKVKGAGGNVGAVIAAIKSPQAVPWALLILVAYFLFKVTVEWQQCDIDRRRLRIARVDFVSGWIVSILAFALYFVQAIIRVQFADLIQDHTARFSWITGICFGLFLACVTWYSTYPRPIPRPNQRMLKGAMMLTAILVVVLALMGWVFVQYPPRVPFFLIGCLTGFLPFSIPTFANLFRRLRSSPN